MSPSAETRAEFVRFGMTASLTGRYAYPGIQALAGVQAWVRHMNQTGGIAIGNDSLPVALVHYDDESSPRRCEELVRRLVDDDAVDVLLGPYSSGLNLRAARVAAERDCLLWNHGGALGSGPSGSSVDILSPAKMYFHGLIDYAVARQPGLRRVTIVHSDAGEFPRRVAAGATEHVKRLRIGVPTVLSYAAHTNNFETIIERVRLECPDLLLAVGRIDGDVAFARQLRQARVEIGLVGFIASALQSFGDELGDAADGVLGPSQWEPGVESVPDYGPTNAEVVSHLADVGHSVVDYPAAQAYAACLVAQRCIEQAASLETQVLRETAGRLDMTTFYGRFRINAASGRQQGHVMPVIQWRNGRKVVVWPLNNGLV